MNQKNDNRIKNRIANDIIAMGDVYINEIEEKELENQLKKEIQIKEILKNFW